MKTKIRVGHAYENKRDGDVVEIISITFSDARVPWVVFQCVKTGELDWEPLENFQDEYNYANE